MSFVSITRILRSFHFHFHPHFFFSFSRSIAPSPAAPLSTLATSPVLFPFFWAFHRTPCLQIFQFSRSFSSRQTARPQNLGTILELIQDRISYHDDSSRHPLREALTVASQFSTETEAMSSLDDCGIKPSLNLVYSVIWELRENWKSAFLAFKWGDKWECTDENVCELLVWVLGSHQKFGIAWTLVRDLHRSSLTTRTALLIMIDRYAAANNPGKAIWTFHVMEKFRMSPDEEAFYSLLRALCNHGNIEEAEAFMYISKKLFPLQADGFNIILSGWCIVCVDIFEAKRIWREMSKSCILPNATSYTLLISCFSKIGNLFDSVRLYEEMKKRGWSPGIEVYNSLIYVLTRENMCKEALKILDKMKREGIQADSSTYNSMIRPLCEAKKLEEARDVLAKMIESKNVNPTTETYHAFIQGSDPNVCMEFLAQMRKEGLGPTGRTFLLILDKSFKMGQPENALDVWAEMKQYQVVAEEAHYEMLVEGLARCGMLERARYYYGEMGSKGFSCNPKLQKILPGNIERGELSCGQVHGVGRKRV
ncbi:Pentatricopeptide repeat-containing protein At1g80880, mitochondrial [Linum grandiflorum]